MSADAPPPIVAAVRAICTALPEVIEETAWAGTRWRVRAATFAHVLTIADGWPPAYARAAGDPGPVTLLMVRAAGADLDAMRGGDPRFVAPPWRRDEVGVRLDDPIDRVHVAELIVESYRLRAPKRLAARVVGPLAGEAAP